MQGSQGYIGSDTLVGLIDAVIYCANRQLRKGGNLINIEARRYEEVVCLAHFCSHIDLETTQGIANLPHEIISARETHAG